MKKIGIVGGIGWRSTVDYYSGICRLSEEWQLARDPQGSPVTPDMCIESLDLSTAISYLGQDDDERSWRRFDEYHHAALQRLEMAGADFALIASNTGHHRLAAITHGITIPVLSIVDAAARECLRIGASEVLILGTALTMDSAVFRKGFEKFGVRAAGPQDKKAWDLTVELAKKLQAGHVPGASERLSGIVRRSAELQFGKKPAVCLACTELPLAFPEQKMHPSFERDGVWYINSSAAHIHEACRSALGDQDEPRDALTGKDALAG
jgi:aspartate racemase